MTTELLLAIVALCAEPNMNRSNCKLAVIECADESATADAVARCYVEYHQPKQVSEDGRCSGKDPIIDFKR